MFERFTDRARRVLVLAQEEARLLNHSFIGTEHILLGLIHEGEGIAARALESLDISLEAVRTRVEETVSRAPDPGPEGSPPFTPRSKKVLELSLREALQLGHNYIGTEHLLLGLIREGEGIGVHVLENLGAELPSVRAAVISLVSTDPEGRSAPQREVGPYRPESSSAPRSPRPDPLVHPVLVLAGPPARAESESLVFRVVGVLVFAEGVRVHWRVSGIPGPITGLMHSVATVSPPMGEERSFPEISDDAGTGYLSVRVTLAPQRPDGELAGASFFTPALPPQATVLEVHWREQVIEVPIPTDS